MYTSARGWGCTTLFQHRSPELGIKRLQRVKTYDSFRESEIGLQGGSWRSDQRVRFYGVLSSYIYI